MDAPFISAIGARRGGQSASSINTSGSRPGANFLYLVGGIGRGVGVKAGIWRCLRFECADVDATVHHTIKTGAALIVRRRRSEARVASVNGWATAQERMRKGRAPVVLKRAKYRIGVNLIARPG